MTGPAWIPELTNLNLTALLDVALDLRDSAQLSQPATIRAVPDVVRFPLLMPGDGINMRDRYLDLRAAALRFLREKGVIGKMHPVSNPYGHRWQSTAEVEVDLNVLQPVVQALQIEYQTRFTQAQAEAGALPVALPPLDRLRDLILRFHGAVVALRTRYANRSTLDVGDEYDAQDLMRVLLTTAFDDIRTEEFVPSYGGGGSRTDFLLKPEQIVLEVKKTRAGLADRQVGEH